MKKYTISALSVIFASIAVASAQYEFENPEANLAREATILVSSEDEAHPVRNLNDNDPYSIWQTSEEEAEIEIDLGEERAVVSVELFVPPQYATPRRASITVGHSLDGGEFTEVMSNSEAGLNKAGENRIVIDFQKVKTRFIKIEVHAFSPGEILFSQIRVME